MALLAKLIFVRDLINLRFQDFKRVNLYQIFPKKPKVINLNANDICNSKCVMCNIWDQKKGFEISPSDLKNILKDPLFDEIEHVGITGGEPTLREDLVLLYQAVIDSIPTLKGLSIITNCIKEKDVIERVEQVKQLCDANNIYFSMMVSLDGVGVVHDSIRGRSKNFDSAIKVISHFKDKIPLAIGCTISKQNAWEADELLDYLKEHGIYGRFRIAEFIKRLYNDNKDEVIRNFSDDEKYNLALFFKKLELTYEKSPDYKRTYKSIHNMLLGGERSIACPYQSEGVVLNSRGELAYCAPKSDVIGDSLKKSSWDSYKKHLKQRRTVLKRDCNICIHDYHAPITYNETIDEFKKRLQQKFLSIRHSDKALKLSKILGKAKNPFNNKYPIVFVFGWYGTETVGDKAILGGIIDEYREQFKNKVNFVVGSLYPFISHKTMKELNEPNIKVIDSRSFDFIKYCKLSDYLVMGGGPLMDLDELYLALIAFKIGKRNKSSTNVIFGCGIGPLYHDVYINAVKEIIFLAEDLRLRDHKSVKQAEEWCAPSVKPIMSGDSAKRYVLIRDKVLPEQNKKNVIACFLREWTYEYARHMTYEDYLKERNSIEKAMADLLREKAQELNVDKIHLHSMHNFTVGNDDRDFSRRFIREHFENSDLITYDKGLATVDTTIEAMKESRLNICMRFHSMLFAESLDTDFMAIDYTLGGKIYNYLNDAGKLDRLISLEDLKERYAVD